MSVTCLRVGQPTYTKDVPRPQRDLPAASYVVLPSAPWCGGRIQMSSPSRHPALLGLGSQIMEQLAAGIPYGEVPSYKWIAERLGRPGAARAVGNAMAGNPVPIIVPCHGVVKTDGGLGGLLLRPASQKSLAESRAGRVTLRRLRLHQDLVSPWLCARAAHPGGRADSFFLRRGCPEERLTAHAPSVSPRDADRYFPYPALVSWRCFMLLRTACRCSPADRGASGRRTTGTCDLPSAPPCPGTFSTEAWAAPRGPPRVCPGNRHR